MCSSTVHARRYATLWRATSTPQTTDEIQTSQEAPGHALQRARRARHGLPRGEAATGRRGALRGAPRGVRRLRDVSRADPPVGGGRRTRSARRRCRRGLPTRCWPSSATGSAHGTRPGVTHPAPGRLRGHARASLLRPAAGRGGGLRRALPARLLPKRAAARCGARDHGGDRDRAGRARVGRDRRDDLGARDDRARLPSLPRRPRGRVRQAPRAPPARGGRRLAAVVRDRRRRWPGAEGGWPRARLLCSSP